MTAAEKRRAGRANQGTKWIDPSGNPVTVYQAFSPHITADRLAAGWRLAAPPVAPAVVAEKAPAEKAKK
jgi:hypothetical protein